MTRVRYRLLAMFFVAASLLVGSLTIGTQHAKTTQRDETKSGAVPSSGVWDDTNAEQAAPFVPTPHDVVEAMLKLAGVTKNDVVYDLGSGDGRIVIAAAKKYGARAVGIEIDPDLVKSSTETAREEGVEQLVTIREQDIFQADFSPATVVTLYLLPHVNRLLRPKLESLKPGTRVVSHNFKIRGWEPLKTREVRSKETDRVHTIYLWKVTGEEKKN